MPTVANLKIEGASLGSYGTNIRIPSMKLAFDIGRCPEAAVHMKTVLVTHGHIDHIGAIGHHCGRRELMGLSKPTYVMGPELVDGFEALMSAYRSLDGSKLRYDLVVIGPGEKHVLDNGMVVRPFRSHHVIPCQGYGIWTHKRKLKPEFHGLPGNDIRLLREKGVDVAAPVEVPLVAFTGDTRIDVVDTEEVVRTAKLLIMEVTFIDDSMPPDKAYRTWHVHLEHLAAKADLFENKALLLTHWSPRYKPKQVKAALRERLPKGLYKRVTPLLEDF